MFAIGGASLDDTPEDIERRFLLTSLEIAALVDRIGVIDSWHAAAEPSPSNGHGAKRADAPERVPRAELELVADPDPQAVDHLEEELAQHATLEAMRARAPELAPEAPHGLPPRHQRPGDDPFFRAGGRGEWREIFTEAEHLRYPDRAAELAPPDLLAWAHEGRRGHDPEAAG